MAKRFKWTVRRNLLIVRFAQKSAFENWAKAQNIKPLWVGEHRATISSKHLPWLQTSGIISQPLALPPAAEPPAADPEPTPDSTWTRDQIKAWLQANGIDTLGLTRKADLLELVQEVH